MKTLLSLCLCLMCALFGVFAGNAHAAQASAQSIILPKPDMSGAKPLMQALADRKSTRAFSNQPVSEQDLSNMLWAAWGVNREDGRRTAPTARNSQAVAVYAVLEGGVWLYNATAHALELVLPGDMRAKYGNAPLTLLFAAPGDDRFGGMHVGSIYQNVALYCASVGLGNLVKVSGRDALDGVLKLPAGYTVLIVQSVGWPGG
jgi:nitroreductase